MLLSARQSSCFASPPSSPLSSLATPPSPSLELPHPSYPPSPGSKTDAFFGSPYASPQPPSHAELPAPIQHPPSLRPGNPASGPSSLSIDFFASHSYPSAPASLRSVSSSTSISSRTDSESSVETPDEGPATAVPPPTTTITAPEAEAPGSTASKTNAFFSIPACPTPPPSLRSIPSSSSICSHISHEDATPRLPPLSRLFPSRYTHVQHHPHLQSSPRRAFVELDDDATSPTTTPSPSSPEFPTISPPSSPSPPIPHDHPLNGHGNDVPLRPGRVLRHAGKAFALEHVIGAGAFSHVWRARIVHEDEDDGAESGGTLVAVKVGSVGSRAAFQREADVLRHLHHPSLPSLHAAFALRGGVGGPDVLVLDLVRGGELLDLVNDDAAHAKLGESAVRRMWEELSDVVAWLHERNVVHRDIKLENVLLTTRFPTLPPPSQPLLKLTDFGLARAIDPIDPWLRTRCGSESYAAPELLLAAPSETDDERYADLSRAPTDGGRHRISRIGAGSIGGGGTDRTNLVKPRREGAYDGRETDAWALGVVLFALVARRLPFDPPPALEVPKRRRSPAAEMERRAWIRRVLKGDVVWPEVEVARAQEGEKEEEEEEVRGDGLAGLENVRRIVSRLLVRDPVYRATVAEVADAW